jgi:hypothetical protein
VKKKTSNKKAGTKSPDHQPHPPSRNKFATLNQIASVLNIEPRRVNQLVKAKIMHNVARGKYDLITCVHDYIAYLKKQIDEARRGDITESQARTQLLKTQEQIKRIELAQAYGEVINLTDAKKGIEDPLKATRDKMLGLARRVSPEIVALETIPEVEALLEKRIEECLYESTTIPNAFNRLAKILQRNNTNSLDDIEAAAAPQNKRVGRSVSHPKSGKQR